MKILIQIPQLIYGGAEKVLVSFANFLVGKGHDIEILETYEQGFLKSQFDDKVKFNAICSKEYTKKYYASLSDIKKEKNVLKKIFKLLKLIFSKVVGYRRYAEKLAAKHYKGKKYDVAINYLETESPEFLLKKICAQKYLQWCHIDIQNAEDTESMDNMIPLYHIMDAIICVAESVKQSFVERYPELKDKMFVLYNFFDTEKIIRMSKEPFEYKNSILNVPKLLSVGRITQQKKYLRFLEVLHRLKKDNYRFQWYLLGTGIQKIEILDKISKLKLNDCVFLEGVADNPYKYMNNCDLFVLPSGWEGFPTVTIEAKILEKPVLATDVSGIREQIEDGKQGLIVENSEEGIYQGLRKILDNPELLVDLSRNDGMENVLDNEFKYEEFLMVIQSKEHI